MTSSFDAYHELLGIPPSEQPPHHYRLLGIEIFETNREVIVNAAARQMNFVRRLGGSRYYDEAQRLLDELAKAKIHLLDPKKRAAYDAQLRNTPAEPASHLSSDTNLLNKGAAWTIGATFVSDVIVNAPIVSRHHARVVCDRNGFRIEDLKSTNGVYVDGERIRGSSPIQRHNIVTLGRQLRLPWPPLSLPGRKTAFRVGYGDDNDMILNHESVAPIHVSLTTTAAGLLFESVGPASETYFDGLSKKECLARIDSNLKIGIGIYTIPLSYLIRGE